MEPTEIHGAPSDHGVGSASPSKKRKRNNITRACTFCRRKRTKCDGKPRCANCILHEEVCSYDGDLDRRKPATKQYIEGLEHRIRQLEAKEVLGCSPESYRRSTEPAESPVAQTSGSLRGPGALRASRTDLLAHYGPSSAYMHLPDEPFQDDEAQEATLPGTKLDGVNWDQVLWSRHLPAGCIPDTQSHTHLLSVFFSYINDWCQWVDESSFTLGLCSSSASELPLRLAHYSPFLHCVILAISLLLSPESMPLKDLAMASARTLADYARSLIEQEALRPMTTTVRGLMLLGSYHFHNGARNLGWLYAGMGARTCQIVGLNVDCHSLVDAGYMSERTKLLRDKTFYTVYIQETLWSFNVGRTSSLHNGDYETALPPIDIAEDLEPWRGPSSPIGSKPGWKSSQFHWACKLMFIADKIHQALYRVQPRDVESTRQSVSKLNVSLNSWYVDLPTSLHTENWESGQHPPYIVNLHASYHYMQILLHRPTYTKRLDVTVEEAQISESMCVNAASHELHKLFTLYRAAGCLRYSTTSMPNMAFTAGTIFLLSAVQNDRSTRDIAQALAKVNDCAGFLAEMAWPVAAVAKDVLVRLRKEWVTTRPSRPGTPGPSSMNTIVALQDPDSDMYRLLKDLGWAPPPTAAPPSIAPDNATDLSATLFAPPPGGSEDDLFSTWPFIWQDLPGPDFSGT